MKTDTPASTYAKAVEERKSLRNATPVEELPEAEQNWLRAT